MNFNIYGYLRVSTDKQDIQNNKNSILNFCNEKNIIGKIEWIEETVSGRKKWQNRLLNNLFLKMNKGDYLIMNEFSRIGRDFLNSLQFICECRNKGIILLSVLGDIPQNDNANDYITLFLNAWKSQTEREFISIRTKQALKNKKDNGIILGRPKKMKLEYDCDNNIKEIKNLIDLGVKFKNICNKFNCTESTLRKFIKKYNLNIK